MSVLAVGVGKVNVMIPTVPNLGDKVTCWKAGLLI